MSNIISLKIRWIWYARTQILIVYINWKNFIFWVLLGVFELLFRWNKKYKVGPKGGHKVDDIWKFEIS